MAEPIVSELVLMFAFTEFARANRIMPANATLVGTETIAPRIADVIIILPVHMERVFVKNV